MKMTGEPLATHNERLRMPISKGLALPYEKKNRPKNKKCIYDKVKKIL
jgi:hypothetical protein